MISDETASRLCAACGMCCNGVLFFSARLQPQDSPRKLEKLGVKIKRRQDGHHLLQPCTAHRDFSCRIYRDRPTRCRLFVCQQLTRLADDRIDEAEAADKIGTARTMVTDLETLLAQAGETRTHKALSTRCESVFTEPLDPALDTLRTEIRDAMSRLEAYLNAEFRIPCPS